VAGLRLGIRGSLAGDVLRRRHAERVNDLSARLGGATDSLGLGANAALLVPLTYRSTSVGVLAAYDRLGGEDTAFDSNDEWLLRSFGASAATAVATAKLVQADQLHHSLEAAERERGRWARELHDEVLQALASVRLRLASASRRGEGEELRPVVAEAVDQLDDEIRELRALIAELRPAALDDFGLEAALATLVERASDGGPHVEMRIELSNGADGEGERFAPEVETAVYRLVQEALTNVTKHAEADNVLVEVIRDEQSIHLTVADDGTGFDPEAASTGFGVTGMRERAAVLGGELTVSSSARGTRVQARVPADTGGVARPE
jgi:two-component system, NarL family, sensor histidine kinase DevS